MTARIGNELGDIVIEDQVIARIASQTTMESYGVVGLAAKGTRDNIYRLLGFANMSRGVQVVPTSDSSIVLRIHVILDAGVRLAMVAENIIESVRYNVEARTGLKVESVDVIVQGLRS